MYRPFDVCFLDSFLKRQLNNKDSLMKLKIRRDKTCKFMYFVTHYEFRLRRMNPISCINSKDNFSDKTLGFVRGMASTHRHLLRQQRNAINSCHVIHNTVLLSTMNTQILPSVLLRLHHAWKQLDSFSVLR